MITLFYDDNCIICNTEAHHLQKKYPQKINIITVSDGKAQLERQGISQQDAMTYLCVQDEEGNMHTAMDAVRAMYSSVGLWFAPIFYLPLVKQLSDVCYPVFARNRYAFPKWFTKLVFGVVVEKQYCENGSCKR